MTSPPTTAAAGTPAPLLPDDETGRPAGTHAGPRTEPRTVNPKDFRRRSLRTRRDFWVFLAFALPNLILILLFTYRPLIANMQYSFLDWTLGSPTATQVGLANYVRFFTGPDAREILSTTAVFTLATVGGSMVLGLAIAFVLNQNLRGTTFARSAVFAPYVLSGVGIGLVWLFIFDPVYGVLAWFLRQFGASSPQWINDPDLALTMVTLVYIWKNLGYCAVVYLAGLQSMSQDVLAASSLDGASGWRQLVSIKLPLLSPTTFFLSITCMLSSLQAFDIIRIMTPLGQGTSTLLFEAYLQAFGAYNRAGYSAAISTVLFVILLAITLLQLRFVEKKVHYS
ncbi:carbohydrate ABC transporter permease [Zhihengliuella halotolerans]|uniref:Carbohydrate ABC transporter membrane protein 1 (CUT1 family) n=1 Tax=Zhihengliuella halotolerans TaxID=370736 RepID=A0A4Q8AB91_9MICC|nr:sugar ABC transporter permease [Zhihengliuella halotolerans]RZU60789.1 carbohydrate ABC transporter membrane protein 1 (CUT1 family) [Zhihengliuella halotolerans]